MELRSGGEPLTGSSWPWPSGSLNNKDEARTMVRQGRRVDREEQTRRRGTPPLPCRGGRVIGDCGECTGDRGADRESKVSSYRSCPLSLWERVRVRAEPSRWLRPSRPALSQREREQRTKRPGRSKGANHVPPRPNRPPRGSVRTSRGDIVTIFSRTASQNGRWELCSADLDPRSSCGLPRSRPHSHPENSCPSTRRPRDALADVGPERQADQRRLARSKQK